MQQGAAGAVNVIPPGLGSLHGSADQAPVLGRKQILSAHTQVYT